MHDKVHQDIAQDKKPDFTTPKATESELQAVNL
jgi:hypothetical protein